MSESVVPGVSGLSLVVPPYRVPLAQWCEWTGNPAKKVEAVVGRSFRVCGPRQNAYTMAADAVLDLIDRYDVDPADVGMLALGTESSTDNAAGAVIVRGMVDQALGARGQAPLSRCCEVPEFKHACLGGVYGLKAAARYLATDGRGRRAIVVTSDIAEYERGSTGEQTQGAGAVAMLLDTRPDLFELDLSRAGSSSAYRGVDFRKPFARHFIADYARDTQRPHDFPVFNGPYSTRCYIDATMQALGHMLGRTGEGYDELLQRVAAVICHRPYQQMPQQALAAAQIWSWARDEARGELDDLCESAGLDPDRVRAQVTATPDLWSVVQREGLDADPLAEALGAARAFRKSARFAAWVERHMSLGDEIVQDLGNLYAASLPGWLGAAFEDAHARELDWAGQRLLALGYGSGDAAEAMELRVVGHWQPAAAKLGFRQALAGAVDLERHQYEALHDGADPQLPEVAPARFEVARVGERNEPRFRDIGVEYYACHQA
ncbi:MAG: hydroxymethylglutaryl-CoA synthase [Myxococcota bacterium]